MNNPTDPQFASPDMDEESKRLLKQLFPFPKFLLSPQQIQEQPFLPPGVALWAEHRTAPIASRPSAIVQPIRLPEPNVITSVAFRLRVEIERRHRKLYRVETRLYIVGEKVEVRELEVHDFQPRERAFKKYHHAVEHRIAQGWPLAPIPHNRAKATEFVVRVNFPASFTEALECAQGPVGEFFPGDARNSLLRVLGVEQ